MMHGVSPVINRRVFTQTFVSAGRFGLSVRHLKQARCVLGGPRVGHMRAKAPHPAAVLLMHA